VCPAGAPPVKYGQTVPITVKVAGVTATNDAGAYTYVG
jgi:hypothetical protein